MTARPRLLRQDFEKRFRGRWCSQTYTTKEKLMTEKLS
jgi:hypothetical protein